ncbi:hypothetical protein [Bdellovibrio sp. HCB337]|uniref:hypothetical protein n=1 Tax=Bdellovibrio sp. HCB337 TaxID=3394358 RepID=UPI0039A56B5E
MKRSLGFFVVILFMTKSLLAQTTVQTTIEDETIHRKSRFNFMVDLNPLFKFNGSYGISLGYDVSPKLNTEITYDHTNMAHNEYRGLIEIGSETTANALGLRFNLFPFATTNTSGFYTSIAVNRVDLKTRIGAASYAYNINTSKNLNDQHIGRQIYMGYQFQPKHKGEGLKLASRIGAGYGNGDEYGVRAGWEEYEIKNSFLFDTMFVVTY